MFNKSHRIRPRTGNKSPEIKALCLSSWSLSQFPTALFTMGHSCDHHAQTVRHSISYVLRITLTFSSPSLTLRDFNPPSLKPSKSHNKLYQGIMPLIPIHKPYTQLLIHHANIFLNFLAYKRYCNCTERIYSYKRHFHFITIFTHINEFTQTFL